MFDIVIFYFLEYETGTVQAGMYSRSVGRTEIRKVESFS